VGKDCEDIRAHFAVCHPERGSPSCLRSLQCRWCRGFHRHLSERFRPGRLLHKLSNRVRPLSGCT